MATVLRLGVRVIICLTLSLCSAYGREGPLPPVPPASVPSSEACTPDTVVWGTRRTAEAATVSVTSMLVPQKAKRAYEHAARARALAGNYPEDAEKELNSALETYPKSAVAWCLMGTLNEERLQFDKAFMDYSQALLADSTSAGCLSWTGKDRFPAAEMARGYRNHGSSGEGESHRLSSSVPLRRSR